MAFDFFGIPVKVTSVTMPAAHSSLDFWTQAICCLVSTYNVSVDKIWPSQVAAVKRYSIDSKVSQPGSTGCEYVTCASHISRVPRSQSSRSSERSHNGSGKARKVTSVLASTCHEKQIFVVISRGRARYWKRRGKSLGN